MALPLHRRAWLALTAGLWLAPACAAGAAHERRFVFGSAADLLVPPGTPSSATAAIWRGLQAMNDRWHAWKPGEVSSLNQALASGRSVRVSPALATLVRGAWAMEQLSMGCFNAGIGGLVGQWGFHDDELRPGRRPTGAELAPWLQAPASLGQLAWRGLDLHSTNPRLQLDFGGYAKGVALDWALDRLRREGVHDALLNLGGNLAAMGELPGRPWRVGVRDPQGGGLLARIDVRGREAVVTSGSYERFRVLDGQRATHILDPRRGVPAPTLISVTVVHRDAALADAAATALLVAGPTHWPRVARSMGVDQVLVLDRHGRRQATPRLASRLH
jgi:FAD:protein FMN transferase